MIGLPYAYGSIDENGRLTRICPVCGERVLEETDEAGEQTTNAYGEHYARLHQSGVVTTDQRLAAELVDSGLDEHAQAEAVEQMQDVMDDLGCS